MNTSPARPTPAPRHLFSLAALTAVLAASSGFALDMGDLSKLIDLGKKTAHAFEATRLTPEQEHYVGRSVAATILRSYRPLRNTQALRYVNLLGQTLAQFSDRPETFGGYRFLILDTDEINGLATPGGFIFITRGLMECCRSEDQLAAVLAHEIAHVQYRHGLRSIRSKRLAPVAGMLVNEAIDQAGGGKMKEVVGAFGGSVTDVSNQLMNSKYSRATEVKADEMAVLILRRAGYDPAEFIPVLQEMERRFPRQTGGFRNTHPSPDYRIDFVSKLVKAHTVLTPRPKTRARAERFNKVMAALATPAPARKDR